MAEYVSASDLILRFDERDIQQLVVDDLSDPSVVDVTSNTRVDAALDDAEGEVIAALRKAGRYNADELAALTGTDLAYLQRIICEIAMVHLLRRRPNMKPEVLEAYEKIRKNNIKDLQDGASIITADEPADEAASLASVDGPTITEWNNMNLWRDRSNYFPARMERQGR